MGGFGSSSIIGTIMCDKRLIQLVIQKADSTGDKCNKTFINNALISCVNIFKDSVN